MSQKLNMYKENHNLLVERVHEGKEYSTAINPYNITDIERKNPGFLRVTITKPFEENQLKHLNFYDNSENIMKIQQFIMDEWVDAKKSMKEMQDTTALDRSQIDQFQDEYQILYIDDRGAVLSIMETLAFSEEDVKETARLNAEESENFEIRKLLSRVKTKKRKVA